MLPEADVPTAEFGGRACTYTVTVPPDTKFPFIMLTAAEGTTGKPLSTALPWAAYMIIALPHLVPVACPSVTVRAPVLCDSVMFPQLNPGVALQSEPMS